MSFVVQHTLVTPPAPPCRWMFFLHGILGSGNNLRALARRLVDACPSWGIVLIDLRLHGGSQGAPPPHSVAAAASDLDVVCTRIPGPVAGITGHSFGGKVSLEFLARQRHKVRLAWILDAMPGPRSGGRGSEGTLRIFETLEATGKVFSSRQQFIDRIVAQGHEESTARWLAMNLERQGEEFVLRLDLPGLRAMLDDYFVRDLWTVIEHPPEDLFLNLVIGGQSSVFDEAERRRAEQAAARSEGKVQVHVLPTAGHWVHIDDPDGLFNRMRASLE
ncbi:MAG: alpha/beta hydrolase [Myxococcales bacterium]|nr:alpha/beta hydrolase [Polyangiaceae bacterium]MDW8248001.1 alpha/beta hydrolase [Myxococcales bacterium]